MAVEKAAAQEDSVRLTDVDRHLFHEGTHYRLYEKFGAHLGQGNGAQFSVWAPNAETVSVIGDFNQWTDSDALEHVDDSGIWSGWIPNVRESAAYKYRIVSRNKGRVLEKADPFAFFNETARRDARPSTNSLVWDLEYEWHDEEWMNVRGARLNRDSPVSIYEVHLGSWLRVPEEDNRFLTYREIEPKLIAYVKKTGFTHVEFLPLTEHPFYGSWGYQCTGYFAPTSRYGTPQDLMFLIDQLHQAGIGVILDWVPSHFATDEHGLGYCDGTHLFERDDPKQRFRSDWQSFVFDYGRPEVRSFLISSAFFWLEKYHIDALRVDAVASILASQEKAGEDFLRQLNTEVYRHFPGVQMIAEESGAWPKVSRPTYDGGLGFGYKWDMGFSHDILKYSSRDANLRKHYHNELTFRAIYAFNENFVLPFSHDDVAYGKCSLLSRMPGDLWQKFANLRLLLAYMYAQPGKKLLFMGDEFAQPSEWNHDASLDWHVSEFPMHAGVQKLVGHLNRVYRSEPALHQKDNEPEGFEWVDCHDVEHSTISWLRWDRDYRRVFLCVFNFTPSVLRNFRVGVPRSGFWREAVNTDAREYGGSGQGNFGEVESNPFGCNDRPHSLVITLPPLAGVFLKCEGASQ